MSQLPPRPGLQPLTSSALPNVAGALQRRAMRAPPVSEATAPPARLLAGMFDGRVDEDDVELADLEEVEHTTAARSAGRSPVGSGTGFGDAPRTFTLGEVIEIVKERRRGARAIVEAGDPDGPEELPHARTLLGAVVRTMQSR